MTDIPDELYYDAVSETAEEEKAKVVKETSEYDYADSAHPIYFELEPNVYSNVQSSSNDKNNNEDKNDLSQVEVFKESESKMKKINTLIKAKVDVSSRAEIFGGKKKQANQATVDKTEKPKPQVRPKVGGAEKMKSEFEKSIPIYETPTTESDKESSCADNVTSIYSLSHVPVNATDEANNSSTVQAGYRTSAIYSECIADPETDTYRSYQSWTDLVSSFEILNEPIYELAKPIPTASKWTDTIKSNSSNTALSANKGCLEGVGKAVPVVFMKPYQSPATDDDDTQYDKLVFKNGEQNVKFSEDMREILKKRGYGTLASVHSDVENEYSESQLEKQDSPAESESEYERSFWGSEFDETSLQYQGDISDIGGYDKGEAPSKPLPPKPSKKAFLRSKSSPNDQSSQDDSKYFDPGSTICLPVTINPQKHPPPLLPPQPNGLSHNQVKRRMIIESIINSERSYLESLERVIKDYEKVVTEYISPTKSSIRFVFSGMKEIISHHKMFQIELSERVKSWDVDETIGDIFTASFSKTMLINAYSTYVNNFAASMEEIRTLQRTRQSFREFMQRQEKLSSDRLSIFGLMVKPVQRFPQFIMFLQDLIKHTPQTHIDRRALQLALTELENVAYRLNERKRQSEQKFQASNIIQQITKQKHVLNTWNLDLDPKRRLIRTDIVEQVQGEFENMKCKHRRLILMNDLVLCVKVTLKEQSDFTVERLTLKWMAKLKDLELKDTAITPELQSIIKREPGKLYLVSSKPEKPEDDPFHLYADLHEMVHDYSVLGQIGGLLSTLKRTYTGHGLKEELVLEVTRDLQRMIQIKEEQMRLVNSCSIILQDTSRSEKPYVLQTQTAAIKQDWCVDFLMAKLSQDKPNNLAWDGTSGSDVADFDLTPAFFMKHLPVDVPKNYTKIRCAVTIFLNQEKSKYAIGVQHLWVCSSIPNRGQVAVLSIHNSKPALMESFKACNSDIMAAELIPGCGATLKANHFLFPEDTVWLTTSNKELVIFPLTSQDGVHRKSLAALPMSTVIISLKFVDERLFCGFDNGSVNVYSRNADGSWNVSQPMLLKFGSSVVRMHFVHEENIWLSCGYKLFLLEIDTLEIQATFELNDSRSSSIHQVMKCGVGIWVSFIDSSIIKLFHMETMENLQEISIGNFVNRIRSEKLWTLNGSIENMSVTCLSVSKGLLWVGTSLGVVLTVPLPRLSDGVPLYRGSPKISLHAHKGPVRFIIPMHCSSNILELNRASSLRTTLKARPSRRNIEREKLELEESQKRKEREKISESGENGIIADRNFVPEVRVDSSNNLSSEILKEDSALTKPELEVLPRPGSGLDGILKKHGKKKKGSKTLKEKGSKPISFRTELAQRIKLTSDTLTRTGNDFTSLEAQEVEELYEILLEDESGIEEEAMSAEKINNSLISDVKELKSNPGSEVSTNSPSLNEVSSLQSKIHGNQSKQSVVKESMSLGGLPEIEQVKQTPTTPVSLSASANKPSISADDSLPPESPVIGFMKGRTSRMTTLRKASSNAVIILSGGDGYCDLDMSRSLVKMEDACTLMWLHKF